MSPGLKVFIASTSIAVALFIGVISFLSSTDDYSQSIDMNQMIYTRAMADADKAEDSAVKAAAKARRAPETDANAPNRTGGSVNLTVSEQEELDRKNAELRAQNGDGSWGDELGEQGIDDGGPERDEMEGDETAVAGLVVEGENDKAVQQADVERGESVELDHEYADKEPLDGEGTDDELSQNGEDADEVEETAAEARSRELKEALGIKKRKEPTRAVDVKLALANECPGTGVALAAVSVQFRHESPIPRGASLQQLELLVEEFRRCPEGGAFQFTENELGKVDASPSLTQMRFDELKYFFIQRSVPRTALRYPETT